MDLNNTKIALGSTRTVNNINSIELPQNQKVIEQGHEIGDWFIFRETRHFGPLNTKQISQFLLSRLLSNQHYIWRPGLTEWIQINTIEAFRSFGHKEIEKISDNDFSFQAQLGPIDRIKFQETEVSFQDSIGTKILNINVQKVQSGITDKFGQLGLSLNELYNELLFIFGIKEEKKKYISLGLGALVAFFVSSMVYISLFGSNEDFFVNKLSKDVREKLTLNAAITENTNAPSMIFLEKDANLKDPIFVGSVNLPIGSKIKININGLPETLMGTFRFSKEIEMTLTSHYFQTEPVRGVSGQFLSPGKYDVTVTCLTCDKSNLVLNSSVFSFGIPNLETYKKDLKAFQLSSRESANLELDELVDLSDTLLDQYQNSMNSYNRAISSKSNSGWNTFSTSWLSAQKKIVELFEQIQSEELKSKLYYLSLYEAYGSVTRMIFELHVMQDKHILDGRGASGVTEQISELSQDIKLKTSYLKSQTELMKINYNRSSGLPPREGLNLTHFE